MTSTTGRARLRGTTVLAIGLMIAAIAAIAAPSSSAAPAPTGVALHTGDTWCTGTMVEVGTTFEGACFIPFQGFPIGIAGLFDSEPNAEERTGTKAAEVHLELLVQPAVGTPRAIGVECEETTTGIARCDVAYDPTGHPQALFEPIPGEAARIKCSAHSHAKYSRLALPTGRFACWSTNEARAKLASTGWFTSNGFEG